MFVHISGANTRAFFVVLRRSPLLEPAARASESGLSEAVNITSRHDI